MSVVTRKRSENFAIIPNHVADDARLSFEARGVLCYLLAKPDDWKIHVNGIRKAGEIGRDKTYRILQELAEAGYLERVETRGEGGRITGYDYIVYDDPVPSKLPFPENPEAGAPLPDLPEAGEPEAGQPDTAQPDTENQDAYIRTNSHKELTSTKDPSHKTNPPKAPRGNGEVIAPLLAVWALEHRPNRLKRAEAMFLALSEAEQAQAIRFAPVYQRRQFLRKEPILLNAYLAEAAWEDLAKAPPHDARGDFIITPEYPEEWSAWLGSIRLRYGQPAVDKAVKSGRVLCGSRFPREHATTGQAA